MNNIRLFFKESLSNNLTGKLNKDQSHYLLKVMRIKKVITLIYSMKMENGLFTLKVLNLD